MERTMAEAQKMGPSRCPRCDSELNGTEKFCPNCKKVLVGMTQPLSNEKPVNCPVCKLPVYKAKMAGRDIFHCAECGGSAYSREMLMKLQALDSKAIDISPQERDYRKPPFFEKREKPPFLICPYCGKKMTSKKLGQMTIDMCEECKAVWLDSGKEKHINDMMGSYKMQMLNKADSGRRQRR
jgi:Zn-finger nucleic acid-binding protein